MQVRANEVDVCENYYFGFMQAFTGKDKETIAKDMSRTKYFTPEKAIEYGLVDKIISKGASIAENKNYELLLAQQQAQQQEMQRRFLFYIYQHVHSNIKKLYISRYCSLELLISKFALSSAFCCSILAIW